jgi:hypothetical protein
VIISVLEGARRDGNSFRDRWGELDSAGSGHSPVASFCEHSNELSGSIKKARYCFTSWVTISFSKNILQHGVSKSRVLTYAYPSSPTADNFEAINIRNLHANIRLALCSTFNEHYLGLIIFYYTELCQITNRYICQFQHGKKKKKVVLRKWSHRFIKTVN